MGMFSFLKLKKRQENGSNNVRFADMDGQALGEGDRVMAYRYELGESTIIKDGKTYYYQSDKTGEKISWSKMVDAATKFQKVKKIN